MRPADLNYQHLRYFHAVAQTGSVLSASRVLHLAPSTISGQIKTLERELGHRLFTRVGRNLVLTDFGAATLERAVEIFELGEQLVRAASAASLRELVRIGISAVLPKLLVREVLRPALLPGVELHIEHGPPSELLGHLATRRLDLVLSDSPSPAWLAGASRDHRVLQSDIAVFGTAELAARVGPARPAGYGSVPWLVPPPGTNLRNGLELWWASIDLVPEVAAVVDDSALLKALGEAGFGLFAAPSVLQTAIVEAFHVQSLGTTSDVQAEVYAISRRDGPGTEVGRVLCGG